MSICFPSDTDWACTYTPEELAAMRADPRKAAAMQFAEATAWYSLAALSAYRIGVCPTTVRPCALGCAPAGTWMEAPVGGASVAGLPIVNIGRMFTPYLSGGNWYNSCGCISRDDCSCTAISEVILPGPVGSIESVSIDGMTLEPTAYRVDSSNRLVRLDGEQWPLCQDMTGDGFQVTYYQGAAPNEMTRRAAGILAAEFYKSCMGSKCRLPSRVTAVSRAGVDYELDTGLWPDGLTTIREVDAVIYMYNPNGLKQAPRVIIPEQRQKPRRQTWGY